LAQKHAENWPETGSFLMRKPCLGKSLEPIRARSRRHFNHAPRLAASRLPAYFCPAAGSLASRAGIMPDKVVCGCDQELVSEHSGFRKNVAFLARLRNRKTTGPVEKVRVVFVGVRGFEVE
jgi:hypothetical protein